MKNALKSYKGTDVHWGRSQAQIVGMLNSRGIEDVQFTNISHDTAAKNGLEMREGTVAIVLVFQKQEVMPDGVSGNIPVRIVIPNVNTDGRALNQYYRVLYWYLKSKFEAIDTGLVEFAEEFMPHLQIAGKNGGIRRLWDTFRGNYYKSISSGEQGNSNLLPPMGGTERPDDESNDS